MCDICKTDVVILKAACGFRIERGKRYGRVAGR